MLHRILPLIGLALFTTASAAQETPRTGCAALALSFDRVMLVCKGMPSEGAMLSALQGGEMRGSSPKVIGRDYRIPPWEITGILSAGYDSRSYRPAVQVVEVARRKFAVYPRGGLTILTERRR